MFWKDVQQISGGQFRRLTGVKKATFEKMVAELAQSKLVHRKHISRGRPSKLSVKDQVLMMLMYHREYRPFFHIGLTYGISAVLAHSHQSRKCSYTEQSLSAAG